MIEASRQFKEMFEKIKEKSVYNPSKEELRELARFEEKTTEFGSPSYIGNKRSRSPKLTSNTIDDTFADDDFRLVIKVLKYLEENEMIILEREIGYDKERKYNCRLILPKSAAKIALGWSVLTLEVSDESKPFLTAIMIPEWESTRILVDPENRITYAVGTDYGGEARKSFLRMWMYEMKKKGGLGMHAGTKSVSIRTNGSWRRNIGQIFFGLSGTGKSALTATDMRMEKNEGVIEIHQDDVVALFPDGKCYGTEMGGMYLKTEGVTKDDQPEIYQALISPDTVFENVWVGDDGKVDFHNTELTSNGRAYVSRTDLGASDHIDMPKTHQLFIITRNPLVPPVSRLSKEQAVVAFMLGESIGTSAGDPTSAGKLVRIVGTNPFIVGPRGHEGNRLLEILNKIGDIEAYLLNTGHVGEGDKMREITLSDTIAILKAISKGNVKWERDEQLKLEQPVRIDGIDIKEMDPRKFYSAGEFESRLKELREDRVAWLKEFKDLNKEMINHVY